MKITSLDFLGFDGEINDEILRAVFEAETGNKIADNWHPGLITVPGIGEEISLEPTESENTVYQIIDCAPGDYFVFTVQGGTAGRAFAFVEDDNGVYKVLVRASSAANLQNYGREAPEKSVKLIINNSVRNKPNGYFCIIGKPLITRINEMINPLQTNSMLQAAED